METFIGTTATGNSEQRRHDKERSRCTDQTHSRKHTAPSPHFIQLFLLKKRSARSTTKAVALTSCVSFHRKHCFQSRSLSTTNVLKSSTPRNVCVHFSTQQPLAANESHPRIKVGNNAMGLSEEVRLGLRKRSNKRVGWPYP